MGEHIVQLVILPIKGFDLLGHFLLIPWKMNMFLLVFVWKDDRVKRNRPKYDLTCAVLLNF